MRGHGCLETERVSSTRASKCNACCKRPLAHSEDMDGNSHVDGGIIVSITISTPLVYSLNAQSIQHKGAVQPVAGTGSNQVSSGKENLQYGINIFRIHIEWESWIFNPIEGIPASPGFARSKRIYLFDFVGNSAIINN